MSSQKLLLFISDRFFAENYSCVRKCFVMIFESISVCAIAYIYEIHTQPTTLFILGVLRPPAFACD